VPRPNIPPPWRKPDVSTMNGGKFPVRGRFCRKYMECSCRAPSAFQFFHWFCPFLRRKSPVRPGPVPEGEGEIRRRVSSFIRDVPKEVPSQLVACRFHEPGIKLNGFIFRRDHEPDDPSPSSSRRESGPPSIRRIHLKIQVCRYHRMLKFLHSRCF
jgi:hypothetical protein